MPVFYAAFSGHVFGGALRDILINCVIDRKKEQITAVYDEKLEARVLLEAVVCQGGSEKAGALIAGEPVCEGILVAVYIVAAFARISAVLQRTSVVP